MTWLINVHGAKKSPEEIMGRPFRTNWKAAMEKKVTDDPNVRLAQKDRERAEQNARLRNK